MADLLIVDDDVDVALLLREILGAFGHACRVAHDGRQALATILRHAPDLVLLDVEMPVLNGPDLAFNLFLRDCGLEEIPIVLLSGVVGLPNVAAQVGTPYFLAKPYDLEAVVGLVTRALQERTPPHPAQNDLAP